MTNLLLITNIVIMCYVAYAIGEILFFIKITREEIDAVNSLVGALRTAEESELKLFSSAEEVLKAHMRLNKIMFEIITKKEAEDDPT